MLGSWYRSIEDTGPVPVRLSGVRGRACRHARGPQGYLNLNLNSLLVKRQIDNPSPGAVTGGN